jgi:TonB family protein
VTVKILFDQEVEAHLKASLESIQPHDGIYKSGRAGMTVPQCDYCPPPQFSVNGVWSKKEGSVVLALLISVEGIVTQVKLLKSIDPQLDDQAIRTAKSYRFHPALDPDGNPATVLMPYTVKFQVSH